MNKIICLALNLSIWGSAMLFAQSPFLDNSFAGDGRFTYRFNEFSRLWCTAIQSDGKILGAGSSADNSGQFRASVLRIDAKGALDTSFANGGQWVSDDLYFAIVTEIIVQPDGKILLTGRSVASYKVVRLNPDGSYDQSFASNGKLTFPVWISPDERIVTDMRLQPNGKILIAGGFTATNDEEMITRIRADGSLDGSFGNFGTIKVPVGLFNGVSFRYGFHLDLRSNNKILASAAVTDSLGYPHGYVLQYTINGTLDTTFGVNGVAKFLNSGVITGLFVLPDDSYYVLGDYSTNTIFTTGLYKFNPNGTQDLSFGINGVGSLPFYSPPLMASNSNSGYLQADGKVVVFGGNIGGVGFLGRYDQNGFPDQSFGTNGTIAPETLFEIFYAGFTQPDGKIVVAGRYEDAQNNNVASLLRYLGSNSVGVIDRPSMISAPLIYPNPIGGQTVSIAYELPVRSPVEFELLDIQGKTLGILLTTERKEGKK